MMKKRSDYLLERLEPQQQQWALDEKRECKIPFDCGKNQLHDGKDN